MPLFTTVPNTAKVKVEQNMSTTITMDNSSNCDDIIIRINHRKVSIPAELAKSAKDYSDLLKVTSYPGRLKAARDTVVAVAKSFAGVLREEFEGRLVVERPEGRVHNPSGRLLASLTILDELTLT